MADVRTDLKKWEWIIAVLVILMTGCSHGYHIHRADGIETLYNMNGNGGKRIVYVVNNDGELKIHDKNDPLIQQFFSDHEMDDDIQWLFENPIPEQPRNEQRVNVQRLVRLGRITAAKKREGNDPIFVSVHEITLGPVISQHIGSLAKTQQRFGQYIAEEMNADQIIQIAQHSADVEVYFKSYFKKTAALNIKTHKIVPVNAFHFEAYIQSNYLSTDRKTIKGMGHWMDYQEIIKTTVYRANKFIKEQIGSSIPKDRESFLSSNASKI